MRSVRVIVIDNVLFSPFRGLLFLLREIHKAAIQEMADDEDTIRQELSRLYLELEAGTLSETEFDDGERALLDRLDSLEQNDTSIDEEGQDDDDQDTDDDQDDDDPGEYQYEPATRDGSENA